MKLKKQKRSRKTVRFFATCYGFRQPFKVLCDGTFVHHLLVNHIVPADQAISNLLGGPVKLFTTSCVLAELKRLGQSHSQSLDAARNLMIARCEHEKVNAADVCLMEVIGKTNQDHFFVATQDSDLRSKFQELPSVPTLFGLRNALFLDPVSASQREHALRLERERSHIAEWERKLLKTRPKSTAGSEEEDDDSDDENSKLQAVKKRKGMEMKDRPQIKRNRAKGPNPLSCKTKKNPKNTNPPPAKQKDNGTADSESVRINRKRKRSRKRKQASQADD